MRSGPHDRGPGLPRPPSARNDSLVTYVCGTSLRVRDRPHLVPRWSDAREPSRLEHLRTEHDLTGDDSLRVERRLNAAITARASRHAP